MREYRQLLLANKAWAAEMVEEHPEFFARQAVGQKPDFLWIGCSDSRVSPEQMTMTQPGGIFMHRNIANLVNDDDLNLMSVIQFAVNVLRVRHIIVCGHYGCGGIQAALDGGTEGPIDQWLRGPRATRDRRARELDGLADRSARINRLVELNVVEQLDRLAEIGPVRDAFAARQDLTLHGWVYDIGTGLIRSLVERGADSEDRDGRLLAAE